MTWLPAITEHYENGTPNPPPTQNPARRTLLWPGRQTRPPWSAQPQLHHGGHRSVRFYSHTDPFTKNILFTSASTTTSATAFFSTTPSNALRFWQAHHDTCSITLKAVKSTNTLSTAPPCSTYAANTPCSLVYLSYLHCGPSATSNGRSYYPEAQVNEIAQPSETSIYPADVIYPISITWMASAVSPGTKVSALLKDDSRPERKGFKTVVIIDPGIKTMTTIQFTEALEKANRRKGEGGYISGKVWPGECYFPDYTDPKSANGGPISSPTHRR